MKQLLTLLLLVLSASAFANTDKNTEPKPAVESHESVCKKTAPKAVKAQETAVKPAATTNAKSYQPANGTTKVCTTAEKSTFGITGYFVDFVHRSNVKLVNMLID